MGALSTLEAIPQINAEVGHIDPFAQNRGAAHFGSEYNFTSVFITAEELQNLVAFLFFPRPAGGYVVLHIAKAGFTKEAPAIFGQRIMPHDGGEHPAGRVWGSWLP